MDLVCGTAHRAHIPDQITALHCALGEQVWPDAQLPLRGNRGIGDQMARFAALATGRTTVTALLSTAPDSRSPVVMPAATSDQDTDSVRRGEHHPAESSVSEAATLAKTAVPDNRAPRRRAASTSPRSRLDQVRMVGGCRPGGGRSRCRC
jgi:hypothetical protein